MVNEKKIANNKKMSTNQSKANKNNNYHYI